ncbi:AAA family ATPase [Persephonella sp. KM09-Lau-8]|uniref:ATP-binding protein n=1 Tax=Persephonella sp. KM09-Lau-8 TaxID=1158345 RepID=UPI0004969B33|nr:AAA family ATPase [Persephonella sp. KM09-Lau-8]
MFENFILSKEKGLCVVRTKDYNRVIKKIIKEIQKINRERNKEIKIELHGEGIRTFEGMEFDKEQLIKDIKENVEKVYIFRNFAPLSEDEIVQFIEKYTQKENTRTKVFIVSPEYEIPTSVEPHIEEIFDYFPSEDEIDKGLKYAEGLSLVELRKANEDGNITEYRKRILAKSGGILEVLETHDVDTPVGLDDTIKLIEKVYQSGIGRGTLLLGVPGTGKTLIAKFLSKKYPVIKFNIGAVYNKYVGETEKRLRDTFERLKQFGNCFVFIDEFEKLIANGNGDSGVSKRVLGELLFWLQDKETNNYVIATMNDISSLPVELVRPGRWDFTFGLTPPPKEIRKEIIKYYSEKYNVPFDENLAGIENITPADISAIYRLASIVGVEKAKKFVKLTKDISPRFEETLKAVERYAVPVYQKEIEDLI